MILNSSIASSPFCEIAPDAVITWSNSVKQASKYEAIALESLHNRIDSPVFTDIAGNTYSTLSVPPPLLATPIP